MTDSPFRAGFGKNPPFLAGREELTRAFSEAIGAGQWGQERAVLIRGFRGVGKTVAINALEDIAQGRQWRVISETATDGFLNRIVSTHLPRILNEIAPQEKARISSASLSPVGSVTVQYVDGREVLESFRSLATQVCEILEPRGGGLLFTLDELGVESAHDMKLFAADFQHLVREDLEVAFVGAGLHTGIDALLKDTAITFLRRSAPAVLDLVSYEDAGQAIREPIEEAGRHIGTEALDYAIRGSQGYPFLVQLIGDIAWKANPTVDEITLADVELAFVKARRSMGAYIIEPSLSDLSPTDRTFLAAMAKDEGPSAVADIRERMGNVERGYISMYRQRLISAGIVYPSGHGKLEIAIPYFREYLREHIVTEAASEISRARAGFPPPPTS